MCDVKTYLSTLRIKVSATSSSAVTMQSVCELKKDRRQNSVTPYMSSLDFTDKMREITKKPRVPSETMYVIDCSLYIINKLNCAGQSAILVM
jgi:hypothetical protein